MFLVTQAAKNSVACAEPMCLPLDRKAPLGRRSPGGARCHQAGAHRSTRRAPASDGPAEMWWRAGLNKGLKVALIEAVRARLPQRHGRAGRETYTGVEHRARN